MGRGIIQHCRNLFRGLYNDEKSSELVSGLGLIGLKMQLFGEITEWRGADMDRVGRILKERGLE